MADDVKAQVMQVAHDTVVNRGASYGTPAECFSKTSELWSAYLGMHVTPLDVAQMMVLLKVGRSKTGNPYKLDTYVDQVGYSSIAAEVSGYVQQQETLMRTVAEAAQQAAEAQLTGRGGDNS